MLEEEKQRLASALIKKLEIKNLRCPMCGNSHFSISDGYFFNFLQEDIKNYSMGKGVPSISIICDNCGFISQHALGSLGLLSKEQPKEGGEDGK